MHTFFLLYCILFKNSHLRLVFDLSLNDDHVCMKWTIWVNCILVVVVHYVHILQSFMNGIELTNVGITSGASIPCLKRRPFCPDRRTPAYTKIIRAVNSQSGWRISATSGMGSVNFANHINRENIIAFIEIITVVVWYQTIKIINQLLWSFIIQKNKD